MARKRSVAGDAREPARYYVQYHNCDRLGWVPLDERPFLETDLGIYTRKLQAREALGGAVLLIVGVGRPLRYYLWETFRVTRVEEGKADLEVSGPGWQLMPPQHLHGEDFEQFRMACANFIAFRGIDELPFTEELVRLAEQDRHDHLIPEVEAFCTELIGLSPNDGDLYYARGFVRERLGLPGARSDLEESIRLGTEFLDEARAGLARKPTQD